MHCGSPRSSPERSSHGERKSRRDSNSYRRPMGGLLSDSPPHGSSSDRSGSFTMASTNVSATNSGTRLAQEIHDEFLVCKICLDSYKNPKCLACLHTFCEECIENHVASESTYKKYSDYREFTCPLCRKRTQLPVGGVKKLPDNFLVSSLTEVVGRQKPSSSARPQCDICKLLAGKQRDAVSKCLDCAKLLCSGCVQLHRQTRVTAGHSLFDVETEKDIECREHRDEAVRFYCEPCDTCVCVLCTFHEHRDHELVQFSEAADRYKHVIRAQLSECQNKIAQHDSQVEVLNRCERAIRVSEQAIHDTAIEFVQQIRNRERQLIEELHNIYGAECMDYIDNKKDLAAQVESLRCTCHLTEAVLNGKDIELLLLKRDVQDKLTSLGASIEIRALPPTMAKEVRFVPGNVDLGYVYDPERPMSSPMRPRHSIDDKSGNSDVSDGCYDNADDVMCGDGVTIQRQIIKPRQDISEYSEKRRMTTASTQTDPTPPASANDNEADDDDTADDDKRDEESDDEDDDDDNVKRVRTTDTATQTEVVETMAAETETMITPAPRNSAKTFL